MLDKRYILENLAHVKAGALKKHIAVDWEQFAQLENQRKKLIAEVESFQQQRNQGSAAIKTIKDPEERQTHIASMKRLGIELDARKAQLSQVEESYHEVMLTIPNPPGDEVPEGKDDRENVELRQWGDRPSQAPQRDHVEIAQHNDWLDVENAVKIAGSRSYFLKNEAVLLEHAILRLTLDVLAERDYVLHACPMLVRDAAMTGTGYYPGGRDQAYILERDQLNLIGTSEVAVASIHMDDVLAENEFPKRYAGISACFRREAGTYGKDTKGLYRVHQFQKVEQVVFCHNDEAESARLHAELLQNSEDIMQMLELPYRVVLVCAGDLGMGQVRKHDIEAWMPSRGDYCETHSCSTFHQFQARRLKTRYKDGDGKMQFVHTLNNTAIATPRVLIPFMEVHQQGDGCVRVPEKLRPYLNGRALLGKPFA